MPWTRGFVCDGVQLEEMGRRGCLPAHISHALHCKLAEAGVPSVYVQFPQTEHGFAAARASGTGRSLRCRTVPGLDGLGQKLSGTIHTGEFAQSCSQSLRALFGFRAILEAKGDRGQTPIPSPATRMPRPRKRHQASADRTALAASKSRNRSGSGPGSRRPLEVVVGQELGYRSQTLV
jgi:hypothetical protein